MKILLLTGKLAEPMLREVVSTCPSRYEIHVSVMPIEVASLATSRLIISHLKKIRPKDYDLIMVPGAIQESMKPVEEAIGIKVVKGPKHAADIPMLLEICDPRRLSPDIPADDLISDKIYRYTKEVLKKTEASAASKPHIKVDGVIIPANPPPIRVVSEITEAHLLDEDELIRIARKRREDGADILSLGFQAGVADPERVRDCVMLIKKELDAPLAIDSIIPSEIIAGVEAGADMVMSLEFGNIKKVASQIRHVPAVIIPYDSKKGRFARTTEDKLKFLKKNIQTAIKYGINKIIADPVLEPLNLSEPTGTLESLMAYRMFKREYSEIPLLMGLCNVTELIDADSVGVNALLTMLAAEARVSLVLVVEKSAKTAGSTAEAKIASQMATVAWKRKTPPKDLGLDLLILKNKRIIESRLDLEGAVIAEAINEMIEYPQDPLGFFTVNVNHQDGWIEVLYRGRKGRLLIRGKNARSIYDEILRRRLISSIPHALYLGVELGKAEVALRTGKSYVQEEPLFKKVKPIRLSEEDAG